MDIILKYSWELFIVAEILAFGSLILFGVFRYFFNQQKRSLLYIIIFLLLLGMEAVLGIYVYLHTGKIDTFQIVIAIFLLYAVTFGIIDFIKLDRWMRGKIGKLRGVELLTEKDYQVIKRNKDPKYIAKKYRRSAYLHTIIFLIVQSVLWSLGTNSLAEIKMYLTDFSWVENGLAKGSPYPSDGTYAIGVIWGIVFIVDMVYSWSYTLFPKKR